MRKPTIRIAGWTRLLGGLALLSGVTAEAQITPADTVNRQRAYAAPTYPNAHRPGGYYYYYDVPPYRYYYYYPPTYRTTPAPAPATTSTPAPAPATTSTPAPAYGYSQPGYSRSGATVAGYRYLDDYATGRGLPLAKPWAQPLR